MSATFGERLRVTVFGQSHSEAMGAVVDGLPAGLRIDTEHLRAFLARRAPAGSYCTSRAARRIASLVPTSTFPQLCSALDTVDLDSRTRRDISRMHPVSLSMAPSPFRIDPSSHGTAFRAMADLLKKPRTYLSISHITKNGVSWHDGSRSMKEVLKWQTKFASAYSALSAAKP